MHDPNEAINFSDRILLINKRKIVSFGKPEYVINRENIKIVYSIDVDLIDFNGRKYIIPKESF
jgi:iron complex transport system ATP-binding protein